LSSHSRIEFEYGAVEVNAKLPVAHGLNGRISLIQINGKRSQPSPQEIVIAESINGQIKHSYHSYPHELSNIRRMIEHSSRVSDVDAWHRYQFKIEPGWLTWSIDDQIQKSVPMPLSMIGARWAVLIQLRTGNQLSWGLPPEDSVWPGALLLDWVKLYSTPVSRGDAEPAIKRDIKHPRIDLESARVSPGVNGLQTAMDIHRALSARRRRASKQRSQEDLKAENTPQRRDLESMAREVDPDYGSDLQAELDEVLKLDSVPHGAPGEQPAPQSTTTLANKLTTKASSLLMIAAKMLDSGKDDPTNKTPGK